jgi:hypothetical protein
MREWQEVHALAIRPLVSGSMAAKYGFDGQDVTNKSKLWFQVQGNMKAIISCNK